MNKIFVLTSDCNLQFDETLRHAIFVIKSVRQDGSDNELDYHRVIYNEKRQN